MRLFRLTWQLLTLSILFTGPLLGQTEEANLEKSIKAHIQSFAKAYENLPKDRNKEAVLKHFSRDMQSNIFYFNISGRAKVTNSNFDGFSAYLDKLLGASAVTIKYEIKELLYARAVEDIATAIVSVVYEIKEEDGIWVKGEETANYALKKQGDGWAIVHMAIMGMEDEKLKGNCLCELYVEEGNASGVVTKTTVPSGKSYTTNFNDFNFRSADGSWLIKTGNNVYRWERGGDLYKMDESGAGSTVVGSSSSKKEIVLKILAKDIYAENCANIKVKASK